MHALLLFVSSLLFQLLRNCVSLSWSVPTFLRALLRASVNLSMETVLWIPFPFPVTVSGVEYMRVNRLRVLCSNFSSSAFANLADSVIFAGGLSTNTRCSAWNWSVFQTVLSKFRFWQACVVVSFVSICFGRMSIWRRN